MSASNGTVVSRVAHAGGSVVRRVRSAIDPSADRPAGGGQPASGWLVVTVFREPSEVEAAGPPAPLAEFGDRIEVRIRPAPAGKGTELAARLRNRPSSGGAISRLSGKDPNADLRSALRKGKQLIEVGEVLRVDPTPHGKRNGTPGGAAVEAATKRAPEGGVL